MKKEIPDKLPFNIWRHWYTRLVNRDEPKGFSGIDLGKIHLSKQEKLVFDHDRGGGHWTQSMEDYLDEQAYYDDILLEDASYTPQELEDRKRLNRKLRKEHAEKEQKAFSKISPNQLRALRSRITKKALLVVKEVSEDNLTPLLTISPYQDEREPNTPFDLLSANEAYVYYLLYELGREETKKILLQQGLKPPTIRVIFKNIREKMESHHIEPTPDLAELSAGDIQELQNMTDPDGSLSRLDAVFTRDEDGETRQKARIVHTTRARTRADGSTYITDLSEREIQIKDAQGMEPRIQKRYDETVEKLTEIGEEAVNDLLELGKAYEAWSLDKNDDQLFRTLLETIGKIKKSYKRHF